MKYGFSTLGCPNWDFKDIVSTAKDLGYDGIEIRGVADEIYAPKIKIFNNKNLSKTKGILNGLDIPMLTSNACIAVNGEEEKSALEAIDYIHLASAIGAKYIRLLCSNKADLDKGNFEQCLKAYRNICNLAKDFGVTPLLETNGMFCNTALLKKLIQESGASNCGILWDIHHPYRYNNEQIEETLNNIGKYVKYVHIKDSVIENGNTVYKMVGHGDIPIKEALLGLKKVGYEGYVTLEWVKRWNPNLEEPGIVFAQFINQIKFLQN